MVKTTTVSHTPIVDRDDEVGHAQAPPPPAPHQFADPTALGLLPFAISAIILGLYHCGVGLPDRNPNGGVGPDQAAFGMCIFLGGMVEFIGGLLHFVHGNTFLMNVHCIWAGFWFSYGMLMIKDLDLQNHFYGDDTKAWSTQIGVYLLMWTFMAVLFLVASMRTSSETVVIFFTLVLTFLLLALSNFTAVEYPNASKNLNKAGGAMCVVCGSLAWYAGGAGIMTPDVTFVKFPQHKVPAMIARYN
ncbi:hypothetical protein KEM55_003088 [Ascosphaera atra]|nr:hypothetical protein KEM55_003088 [Ascosphaera atra]